MIGSLPSYSRMRDSGFEWLGPVPAHWGVRSLGSLVRFRSERGRPELPLLSVVRERGVIPRLSMAEDENHNFIPDDLSNYKVVRTGDLVINKMKAWQGSLGIAPVDGIVSPAYYVLDFAIADPQYGHLLLRCSPYVAFFGQVSDGVRVGQWDLAVHGMKRIPVVIPPAAEQRAIARFIAYASERISRFVETKQKLVKLLLEQTRTIVSHAVMRGVDSDVRLRASGVEWLGEMPEHWRIGRIKTELLNLNSKRVPLSASERGEMASRGYDYYGASGVIDKVDGYLFDDDLLLIAEDGANLVNRNLPLAIVAHGRFWVNNHAHILKPKRGSLEFFAALLDSIDYQPWITGAAQPKLTQDRLMAVPIPVPPAAEQEKIAAWIKISTADIQRAIERARGEVALLREFRSRLIADVVTGKLDVREAAARLPKPPLEPDTSGKAKPVLDIGEDVASLDLDADLEGVVA
jgi:type I restriction enzyme S subunit